MITCTHRASKFALDGLYEHVEAELHYMKEDHIQLTTVYPMVVNTKLVSDISHRCAYKHRQVNRIRAQNAIYLF